MSGSSPTFHKWVNYMRWTTATKLARDERPRVDKRPGPRTRYRFTSRGSSRWRPSSMCLDHATQTRYFLIDHGDHEVSDPFSTRMYTARLCDDDAGWFIQGAVLSPPATFLTTGIPTSWTFTPPHDQIYEYELYMQRPPPKRCTQIRSVQVRRLTALPTMFEDDLTSSSPQKRHGIRNATYIMYEPQPTAIIIATVHTTTPCPSVISYPFSACRDRIHDHKNQRQRVRG